MNREEAEILANELLSSYGKSDNERWTDFTAVLTDYLAKEEAAKMLAQIVARQAPAMINNVKFAFKKAWMEEDQNGRGRILAEYTRE